MNAKKRETAAVQMEAANKELDMLEGTLVPAGWKWVHEGAEIARSGLDFDFFLFHSANENEIWPFFGKDATRLARRLKLIA